MKWIIGILLLATALVGCTVQECPTTVCPACEECPEEQALIYSQFDSWGENINNPNEVIFNLYVMNFGEVEAKNVEVTCYAINTNGDMEVKVTKNVGNSASKSWEYREVLKQHKIKDESSNGFCYVSNCDNCEILNNRLLEFEEMIK